MKIQMYIGTMTLDGNTEDENNRYAVAVKKAVKAKYPNAIIDISLVTDVGCTDAYVDAGDDDDNDRIYADVATIAERIYSDFNY